jgi:hypothetical protein
MCMALINHRAREIHFKIVYYGPSLGGKTTNLQLLYDRLPPDRRGRMLSIATDHERTLFFDFLPVDIGAVNGFVTRFHLYTVPGQIYYRLSRRAVLRGVDGLVFVADSHPAREQANRDSLVDLEDHLTAIGLSPAVVARIPRIFQWNKRDLAQALPVERLRAALNPARAPEIESVAKDGPGVSETLRTACKLVLARLAGAPEAQAAPGAARSEPAGAPARPDAGSRSLVNVGAAGSAGATRVPGATTMARPPAAPRQLSAL